MMNIPHARAMNRRTRQPRGYVLLLTLMVLAVAAAALAGVCRAGLQAAVQASRAQEDLQRRWGVASCRAALFAKSPAVFGAPRPPGAGSLSEIVLSLNLGGQPMTLVFGDEQAKANVNLLYASEQRAGADRAVRAFAQASGATLRVELRPMASQVQDPIDSNPNDDDPIGRDDADDLDDLPIDTFEPLFEGWGQVFAGVEPGELIRRRGPLPSVASNLTCWSDGLVNVRRASREVMLRACARVLGPADVGKLLAARDKDPAFDLWETLDALSLPEARRDAAERLLADESRCYSLWIVTRAGPRQWYDLTVGDILPGGRTMSLKTFGE